MRITRQRPRRRHRIGERGGCDSTSPRRQSGVHCGVRNNRLGTRDRGLGQKAGHAGRGTGAGSSSAPTGPRGVAAAGAARPPSGPTRSPWAGSGFPILFFLPILFSSPRRGEGGSAAPRGAVSSPTHLARGLRSARLAAGCAPPAAPCRRPLHSGDGSSLRCDLRGSEEDRGWRGRPRPPSWAASTAGSANGEEVAQLAPDGSRGSPFRWPRRARWPRGCQKRRCQKRRFDSRPEMEYTST